MELAGYLVNAVVLEGRPVREVARAHGVSKTWLYELLARHRELGEAAFVPRSRRPRSCPSRVSPEVEDEIVELRKSLAEEGLDAGAHTIQYHLWRKHRRDKRVVPSVATIWRVLKRRGFVVPEPHKRPKCSYVRFNAELPNQCWQADTTHWCLADGTDVEVLNMLDDHSRLLVASVAFAVTKAKDVVAVFQAAAEELGLPASVLTDNGAIFSAESRGGRCAMETLLVHLGVDYKHGRPYHPQTQGKVERFHQTLKRWLAKQPRPASVEQLQSLLDQFRAYYNNLRPHRAIGRRTPAEAYAAREKAAPKAPVLPSGHYRLRRDRVDKMGKVSLRYQSRLRHIGLGRAHAGQRVLLLIAERDVRVLSEDGELIGTCTIDPANGYQALQPPRGRAPAQTVRQEPTKQLR
ncbi:MAG TPA: IS481 family transposase [Acidimicrobiales bacterium]|nr:IS481 family transposase [Acidimicrobiales bacterium]